MEIAEKMSKPRSELGWINMELKEALQLQLRETQKPEMDLS